jgi:ABC-type lipoprotein export system ATPase subunit
MKIELGKIIPQPLPESLVRTSETWGEEITFDQGQSVLAQATSGKGKSTLLHILYGLRKDFSGTFSLEGTPSEQIKDEDWRVIRSQKISILFQDLRLFPHLTARENLSLLPQLSEERPPVEEMCERLGVHSLIDQQISNLSLGQRQRIALIRSLRKPFKWLLLDEPFSHLDEHNTDLAIGLIEEIRKGNRSGLILTSLNQTTSFTWDRSLKL